MKKRSLAIVVPLAMLGGAALAMAVQRTAPPSSVVESPVPDATLDFDPLPVPAGTYVLDPHHAALTGKLRHAGLSHFAFRFRRFDARFTFDPENPESPSVEVSIDPSSIDTNVDGFDTNMITSERHFNVSNFTEIKFVSNSLKRTGDDTGVLEGNLTFLGVTKPLNMDVIFWVRGKRVAEPRWAYRPAQHSCVPTLDLPTAREISPMKSRSRWRPISGKSYKLKGNRRTT